MSSNPSGGAASYKLEIKPSAAKELPSLGTKKDRAKIAAPDSCFSNGATFEWR
jgi:hypothetical protein